MLSVKEGCFSWSLLKFVLHPKELNNNICLSCIFNNVDKCLPAGPAKLQRTIIPPWQPIFMPRQQLQHDKEHSI